MKKIKWGCIQPLTGGMYIGAYEAIGHSAEWILSYDGLDSVITNSDGEITVAGNEYNLRQWLEKNNLDVPYYVIKNRQMFDACTDTKEVDIYKKLDEDIKETPDYSDIDLVVAVPVCSGLSMVTKAADETKQARNCNMEWLAYYTLNVIKPKVYCFENAPTLMSGRGDEVRYELERIAKNAGYSVLYYKTDTILHHNCQKRPRTFVIFMKWQNGVMQKPALFGYENETILVPEFFDSISKDAPQQIPVKSAPHNYMTIDFMTSKYGEDWPKYLTKTNVTTHILDNKLVDEFFEFIENGNYDQKDKDRAFKYINHILNKKSQGLNYYSDDAALFTEKFPSVQFRSIPDMLHYSGKRFCTIREYLSLMGMPEDFILYGNSSNLAKIGQNVPVKTAKFIVSQILNILDNWDYINRGDNGNIIYQDNVKQKVMKYEKD